MLKEKVNKCLQMTEDIMTSHYRGNHDVFKAHVHKACLWIGSIASEYYHGKEKIIEVLKEKKKELPDIILTSREFECVFQDRNSCTIVGRYIGITDMNNGELFRDMQRVTFGWKEEKEQLYIRHIHVSNPMANVQESEIFPHKLGIFTHEYMNMLLRKELKSEMIKIKDQQNVYHIIQLSNIIFLEAFDHRTLIHTTNGDFLTRMLLLDVEKKIMTINDKMIIRVHKSYAVNKYYIDSIQRYEMKLAGEYRIPISKQKYLDVLEKLHTRKMRGSGYE